MQMKLTVGISGGGKSVLVVKGLAGLVGVLAPVCNEELGPGVSRVSRAKPTVFLSPFRI